MSPLSSFEIQTNQQVTVRDRFNEVVKKTGNKLYRSGSTVIFLVITAVARIFTPAFFSAPFIGFGLLFGPTKLVINTLDWYDRATLVHLKLEACKLSRQYPFWQITCFVITFLVSVLSPTLGMIGAGAVGCFGATIIDVETLKQEQNAGRLDYR